MTLNSLIDDEKHSKVDSIIVYDTGSTDRTLEILSEFCQSYGITKHIKKGTFVDFATSRNQALRFADGFREVDFLLLMDCNDELKGDLREYCETIPDDKVAWLLHQCWWSGVMTRYYNLRLIRPRCGWKYRGVVHEYLTRDIKDEYISDRVPGVELYQDRTQDDDKTSKRFKRDKKLLLREYRREGSNKDPRTVFYLAQTYSCLHEDDLALKHYTERSQMEGGFVEETFHAYYNAGKFMLAKGMIERGLFYLMESTKIMPRVEPLLEIVKYYRDKNMWLATQFGIMACKLEYPGYAVLFVDESQYRYERYHLLSIVAFYAGDEYLSTGYEACQTAVSVSNSDVDNNNLKIYRLRLGLKDDDDKDDKDEQNTGVPVDATED